MHSYQMSIPKLAFASSVSSFPLNIGSDSRSIYTTDNRMHDILSQNRQKTKSILSINAKEHQLHLEHMILAVHPVICNPEIFEGTGSEGLYNIIF